MTSAPARPRVFTPCAHHPRAQAGWTCEGCAAALCPECVARTQATQVVTYDSCVQCEGIVFPLLGAAAVQSFGRLLLYLFRVPVGFTAFLTAVGLLVWSVLSCRADLDAFVAPWTAVAWDVALGAALTITYFLVLHSTAQAPDRVEDQRSTSLMQDGVLPALRFLPAVVVALGLPIFEGHGAVLTADGWVGAAPHRWIWSGPAMVGVVLVSSAAPVLVMRWYARGHGSSLERVRLGEWVQCAAITGALGLTMHSLFWSGVTLDTWVRPSTFTRDTSSNVYETLLRIGVGFFALVLARVHGMFLHAIAPRIDYPLPDRYRAPVLNAVPRGTRKPKVVEAPKRSYEPIEL